MKVIYYVIYSMCKYNNQFMFSFSATAAIPAHHSKQQI